MIYLDHSATALPKPKAVEGALVEAFQFGNPGRSGHGPGLDASRSIFECRIKVAELLDTPDEESIVFTSGATQSLNMAIWGTLNHADKVISSNLEHNAVARCLNEAQEKLAITWEKLDGLRGDFAENLETYLKKSKPPNVIVLNHVSNVTGVKQDIKRVRELCLEYKILLILDAAQSIGLEELRLYDRQIICFSAHKGLMGPMGVGVLALGSNVTLQPTLFGGTGSNSESIELPAAMPDRYEVGTANALGIHAFKIALDEFERVKDVDLQATRSKLFDGLKQLSGVKVYGPEIGGSAISIDIPGCDLGVLAHQLWQKYKICTRVGLHCSPLAHMSLGTFPNGTMRVSVGKTTKLDEITEFLKALNLEMSEGF